MNAVFRTTGANGREGKREVVATYSAGDKIFSEGDLGTEMYIIQEGEVHIIKRLGNEDHLLSRLGKGDFFGEMAVIESAPRTADAVAQTATTLLAITGSRFDEMIRRNPEIAIRIIRKYSRRLRDANTLLESLASPTVPPEGASVDAATLRAKETQRRLVEIGSATAFHFTNGDQTTIGRADPVTGIRPDIDLTAVDIDRSVSRRHAKIIRSGEGYAVLEEVGTLNGTFVNDERVQTGVPFPLSNGDRLRIGLVQLKVVYEE
jgi:CRP-like cAMP-binding protein